MNKQFQMFLYLKSFVYLRKQLLFSECLLKNSVVRVVGFAGRVSPRRATSFLARARKEAKKACWRSLGTAELATRLRRYARTAAVSQTGGGLPMLAAVP